MFIHLQHGRVNRHFHHSDEVLVFHDNDVLCSGGVTVGDVIACIQFRYPHSVLSLWEDGEKTRLLSSTDIVQNARVYIVRRNPVHCFNGVI